MKKIIIPLGIVLMAAAFVLGFFLGKGIQTTDQSASLYNAVGTTSADYRSYVDQSLNGGGSGCVRKIWQDNGAYSWYVGHWNGSGDCQQLAQHSSSPVLMGIPSQDNPNDNGRSLSVGILDLQIKLAQLGLLDDASVTGTLSPVTMDAIKKFQASKNITTAGYLDQETLNAIGSLSFQKTVLGSRTIWKLPTAKTPVLVPAVK